MTGVLVRKRDGTQKQMDPEEKSPVMTRGRMAWLDAGQQLVSTSGDPETAGDTDARRRAGHRPSRRA